MLLAKNLFRGFEACVRKSIKGESMKLQSVNNQTTFTATAQYRPIAPRRLRGMLGLFGDFSTERKHFFSDDTDRILTSLQESLKKGQIKRSSKSADSLGFNYYQDKKVFDFEGDTLILHNNHPDPKGCPSAIYIAHEAEGQQGSTEIFRYFSTAQDKEYDKLAEMLEKLPANQ